MRQTGGFQARCVSARGHAAKRTFAFPQSIPANGAVPTAPARCLGKAHLSPTSGAAVQPSPAQFLPSVRQALPASPCCFPGVNLAAGGVKCECPPPCSLLPAPDSSLELSPLRISFQKLRCQPLAGVLHERLQGKQHPGTSEMETGTHL